MAQSQIYSQWFKTSTLQLGILGAWDGLTNSSSPTSLKLGTTAASAPTAASVPLSLGAAAPTAIGAHDILDASLTPAQLREASALTDSAFLAMARPAILGWIEQHSSAMHLRQLNPSPVWNKGTNKPPKQVGSSNSDVCSHIRLDVAYASAALPSFTLITSITAIFGPCRRLDAR